MLIISCSNYKKFQDNKPVEVLLDKNFASFGDEIIVCKRNNDDRNIRIRVVRKKSKSVRKALFRFEKI